jgi:hypothetical protein
MGHPARSTLTPCCDRTLAASAASLRSYRWAQRPKGSVTHTQFRLRATACCRPNAERQQRRPYAVLQGLLRQHHAPMELEMASDDETPEPQPEEVQHSNTTVSVLPVDLSNSCAYVRQCFCIVLLWQPYHMSVHVQVMLPGYLRADFDKYFGQGAGAGSTACEPVQSAEASAPPAQEGSAGTDGMAAARIVAEPDDGAAAAGSSRAGAGDSGIVIPGCGTSTPMPASPKSATAVQSRSMSEHQVLEPAQEPDSPPRPGRAAVALDFMDADGPRPQQIAGDTTAAAAFTATGTEQPTATQPQEAAAPIIDLVFDDASGTMQQTVAIDGAAQRVPAPAAPQAAAPAIEPVSVSEAVPVLAAVAAAGSQELHHSILTAATLPATNAPVMPAFRSRVSRMQLPNQPAVEDEDDPEQSDDEMASGM